MKKNYNKLGHVDKPYFSMGGKLQWSESEPYGEILLIDDDTSVVITERTSIGRLL